MITRCLPVLACLLLATDGSTVDQRVLIEQALDESTRIELTDVKLGEAFALVTEQTGVEVVMTPEVMSLIPYGPETKVNATIENIPLRQGLIDLVAPLGMTFVVLADYVEIIPTPPLLRLGRPATWAELDLLGELRASRPGVVDADMQSLRDRLQFQVRAQDPFNALAAEIRATGVGSGDEVLSVACDKLGWSWSIDGDRIVVLSIEQQFRRQLQWPIRLKINDRPLPDVIRHVGLYAGVPVRLEPGALQSLPVRVQEHFALNVNDLSAEEALEMIASYTGLGYLIDREGVLFYRTASPGAPTEEASAQPTGFGGPSPETAQPRGQDPYVGKITVQLDDGKTVEWLIRESELPQDLKLRRRQDLQDAFDALRGAPQLDNE
jgi:hypothetical protein